MTFIQAANSLFIPSYCIVKGIPLHIDKIAHYKKNLFIIRGLLHKHRACISNNCYIPTAPFCSHTRSRHPNLHLIITSSNPVIRSVPNVLYSNLRNLTLNRSGPLCPSYNLLFTFHGPKYFRLDTTMTYLKPIPSQEYYLPFIIFDW